MTEIDAHMTIGIFVGFFIGLIGSQLLSMINKSLEIPKTSNLTKSSKDAIWNKVESIVKMNKEILELLEKECLEKISEEDVSVHEPNFIEIDEDVSIDSSDKNIQKEEYEENSTSELQSREIENIFNEIVTKNSGPSPEKEKEIMMSFTKNIVDKSFGYASKIAKDEGYILYPIYINNNTKLARSYNPNVLGVRLKDPNYSQELCTGIPSREAIVTEIVDVGGTDPTNRGMIKL